jgi:topoisomerase-4 subunit A
MIKDKITEEKLEKIIESSLEDIFSDRFSRYSKYVIQDRAIPDARDGLKPVQRRILYSMNQMGLGCDKPYKKSARIVGDVIGKYHPHGDSSVYEAMVRMSQSWKLLTPLIDMHGNNGSIDGDSPAAMRYTEARMSKAASLMLLDIDKKTVPFVPNFDDEELEPTVLPSKFPNILVNGATGISEGYATKIPPHNLQEIIDATIYIIDHKYPDIHDLFEIVKGPDFPTGGIVMGSAGIRQALETGIGKVVLRSKTRIEKSGELTDRIIIDEIPYEILKGDLVKQIDMLRIEKKLDDIVEIRDESDKDGLRISIDLKKGVDAKLILNFLFKNSNLQVNYNYNMVSILNHRPVTSGIITILNAYIAHQEEVVSNRCNYDLEKAKLRKHIVDGFIKMMDVLDELISIIRKSNGKADSKNNIIKAFEFTDIQAEAIVVLQLYRLSKTDVEALKSELVTLGKEIDKLEKILGSKTELKKVIKNELIEVGKILGKPRKAEIVSEVEVIKIEDKELVSNEQVIVGVTKDGYFKKSTLKSYQANTNDGLKEHDGIIYQSEEKELNNLLIFTNFGKVALVPVYKIDETKWKDYGVYIGNIIDIEDKECIVNIFSYPNLEVNDSFLLATSNAKLKQIYLSNIKDQKECKSYKAFNLDDNEVVVSVNNSISKYIVTITEFSYVTKFLTEEIPYYGLGAGGIIGCALGDEKLSSAFYANDDDDFIILTSRGNIIKDSVANIPLTSRARRGSRFVEVIKKNPHLIVSATSLSLQEKTDNIPIRIKASLGVFKIDANSVKRSDNKFGMNILPVELGNPLAIFIKSFLYLNTYKASDSDITPNNNSSSKEKEIKVNTKSTTQNSKESLIEKSIKEKIIKSDLNDQEEAKKKSKSVKEFTLFDLLNGSDEQDF